MASAGVFKMGSFALKLVLRTTGMAVPLEGLDQVVVMGWALKPEPPATVAALPQLHFDPGHPSKPRQNRAAVRSIQGRSGSPDTPESTVLASS